MGFILVAIIIFLCHSLNRNKWKEIIMHPLISKDSKWVLQEDGTSKETIVQNETLFALSNGHFGTRGSLEEASRTPDYSYSESTLVNAFYDSEPIEYGEWAYGYAKNHQTIIPVPNGKKLTLTLDGETFDLETGSTTDHKRALDLEKGVLTRTFTWTNTQDKSVDVKIERFVSYDYPELLVQKVWVTPHEDGSELELTAELDDLKEMGQTKGHQDSHDPRKKVLKERRFDSTDLESEEHTLMHITPHSTDLNLIVGATNALSDASAVHHRDGNTETWKVETRKSETVSLERWVAYGFIFTDESKIEEQSRQVDDLLSKVKEEGYDSLKEKHLDYMKTFWSTSDIQIDGDDTLQTGLRFNLFHLHQAAGRDGLTNMSAKGLTGEGYEGHYFWDTEMYMLPFFIYTQPEIAKQLLRYRYSILPQARERAREMAIDDGALFAWRTINGEEASPYYPAGTAQIHINADIAHAVHTYLQATDDSEFGMNEGLEILIETARFYETYGHYDELRDGAFVLNDVTGPDEYTAIVNNNFYTNLLAKHNLNYAIEWVEKALDEKNEDGQAALEKVAFEKAELDAWKKAADNMFLPYDEKQQLTMQDDSFFHKKVWDFDNTPEENYPLLLHYHPLTIYGHQVNKQADTVLAQFLFSTEFSLEQKERDYHYYEAITTHDSSLSRSVFGMMASDLGDLEKAYNYFMDTALMDITNMQGNTNDGVHTANMGGTWMSIVYGFGGLRIADNTLHFSPKLPKQWNKLSFTIQFKGRTLQLTIKPEGSKYTLLEGEPLEINHFGEKKVI